MKEILLKLFKVVFLLIVSSLITIFISLSFMTGEFPPKVKTLQTTVFSLKSNIEKLKRQNETRIDTILGQTEDLNNSKSNSISPDETINSQFNNNLSEENINIILKENQILKNKIQNIEARIQYIENYLSKKQQK